MINFGRAFIKNTKVFRSEDKTKYIIMLDTGISKPMSVIKQYIENQKNV